MPCVFVSIQIEPIDPCYAKWFGIEKDEATFRLLADATPLNQCMLPPPKMFLPSIHDIITTLLEKKWAGQLDARSFFFQFPLGEPVRNYFGAKFGTKNMEILVRALVLLMGWNHSP